MAGCLENAECSVEITNDGTTDKAGASGGQMAEGMGPVCQDAFSGKNGPKMVRRASLAVADPQTLSEERAASHGARRRHGR